MTKFIQDGVIQTHLVATLDPDLPSLALIEAGIDLTPYMRSLDTPLQGSTADAATADSKFNATVASTYGGQDLTGEFVRHLESGEDLAWASLPRGTHAYIVRADRGGSGTDGALAIGDEVSIYEIDIHTRNPAAYGRSTLTTFTMAAGVPSEPVEDVALVA